MITFHISNTEAFSEHVKHLRWRVLQKDLLNSGTVKVSSSNPTRRSAGLSDATSNNAPSEIRVKN